MEEYRDLEDELTHTHPEFKVSVKCDCGHVFDSKIYYGGVVAGEERQMGAEKAHVWNNEMECTECGEGLTVECALYEYPEGTMNHVDFNGNSNCTVLNESEIIKKLGFKS